MYVRVWVVQRLSLLAFMSPLASGNRVAWLPPCGWRKAGGCSGRCSGGLYGGCTGLFGSLSSCRATMGLHKGVVRQVVRTGEPAIARTTAVRFESIENASLLQEKQYL